MKSQEVPTADCSPLDSEIHCSFLANFIYLHEAFFTPDVIGY